MLAKRLDEIQDLDKAERKLLGLDKKRVHYVTFRKGHMQVDVKRYVRSCAGKKSVANVIQNSPGKRKDDESHKAK